MKFKKLKKGFTLVELVVVIAVIAVLAAVSVGAYFGVTESAKVSNATNYLKQVKDMWMVYVATEYDETATEEKNAEIFAADYASSMGLTVDINYRTVLFDSGAEVSQQNTSYEEAILFKVESEYTTWFLVNDLNIITSSDVYKTEDQFIKSVKDCAAIVPNDENDNFDSDTFMLYTMVDASNVENKVRGFKYVKYVVNHLDVEGQLEGEPHVYVAPWKTALRFVDDTTVVNYSMDQKISVNDPEYPENTLLYLFENADTNEDYDTEEVHKLENIYTEKAIINGKEINRGYVCGTYNVNRLNNKRSLNTDNYPAYYIDNSTGNPIHKFYEDADELIGNLKENKTNTPSYIFLDNTTLDGELDVISNHKLIVDYITADKTNDLNCFRDITDLKTGRTSFGKVDDGTGNLIDAEIAGSRASYGEYRMLDSDERNRDDLSANNGLSYKTDPETGEEILGDVIANKTKTFTNKGTINILKGAELLVEAYVSHASAQRGAGVKEYGEIDNQGTINLIDSNIRTLGKIKGTGVINATGTSNIYDLFKFTSFLGGTISANAMTQNVFPFNDYVFDNIQCSTHLKDNTSYTLMACAYAENKFNNINAKFFNLKDNEEGIFYSTDPNAEILLSYDSAYKTKVIDLIKGTFQIGNTIFDLGVIEKFGVTLPMASNAIMYKFPISNMDINVGVDSILQIGDNQEIKQHSHKYDTFFGFGGKTEYHYAGGRNISLLFLPNASLNVLGKVNLEQSKARAPEKASCDDLFRDLDKTLLETMLKTDFLDNTTLAFGNYNKDQLQTLIRNFPTTNKSETLLSNIYQLTVFNYFLNNIDYWNNNDKEMFTIESTGTLVKPLLGDVTNEAVIYFKNPISIDGVEKTSFTNSPYEYKYLAYFEFLNGTNLFNTVFKGTSLGEASTDYFENIYNFN